MNVSTDAPLTSSPLGGRTEFSPEIVEKYEVLEKIGEGAMGQVYKVRHRTLDRFDVIKLIHSRIFISEDSKKKFIREARTNSQMGGHKNLVTVYDAGGENDTPYIAFEYVSGVSLDKKIKEAGTLPLKTALFIAKEICDGMQHAHEMGFVHRDIKSENIILSGELIEGQEIPKIADFGIAKAREPEDNKPKEQKKQAWVLFGTPSYMSPEQASGDEATERSDQYSTGIVLYEMLTGQLPFKGIPLQVIMKHINEVPKFVHDLNPEVPPQVSEIIAKTLEKNAADRFESMADLGNKLERALKFADKWVKENSGSAGRLRQPGSTGLRGMSGSTSRVSISSSAYAQTLKPAAAAPEGILGSLHQILVKLPPPINELANLLTTFQLQIKIGAGALALLTTFGIFLLTRGYNAQDFIAKDLRVVSGIHEIILKWKSVAPYPSVVSFGDKEDSLREFEGSGSDEREHMVKVPNLLADTRYYYRIVYPDGKTSLPYRIDHPDPDFHFTQSSQIDGVVTIYGRTSIPAKVKVHYQRGGQEATAGTPDSKPFDTNHQIRIEDMSRDQGDSLEKVVLEFETGESADIPGKDITEG